VISQAIVSNIGGTATLIGDPPNIIIGSKVGLNFNQFLVNLSLPVILSLGTVIAYMWATNRDVYKPINTSLSKLFAMHLLQEKIRYNFLDINIDKLFLGKSLGCLILALLLFVTQTVIKISPGVAALFVAMILFTISKVDVEEMLQEIEWSTLLFFAGLFILVGVLEEQGVIEWVARNIFLRVGHNPYVVVLVVLWVSGIISGFLDNIPFTIAMIPMVQLILESTPIPNHILWWALSLGACLGGNLTMVGSSANIVSVGMAKRFKYNISFLEFIKSSAVITIITLLISSVYLMLYLWLVL